jgi:tRNA threonylcarbamoyladenosine biosynthesis protein TsaB
MLFPRLPVQQEPALDDPSVDDPEPGALEPGALVSVLVVAIESATDAAGVALADESGTVAQTTLARGRRHAETIAPAIRSCCEQAGVRLADVDAIAVDVGPGLFTGLRVGVATAKGLAYALRKPIVALDSLEVLARAASTGAASTGAASTGAASTGARSTRIIPVLDARRREVVSAEFAVVENDERVVRRVERISEERLETPGELAARLSSPGVSSGSAEPAEIVLVGDGALRYVELFEPVRHVRSLRIADRWLASPPVAVLAEIAVERVMRSELDDPAAVLPRYLRQADTRINWSTRAPRHAAAT